MISYEPLWKTMKDRGVTTYTLIDKLGFSAYTITNLEKLCAAQHCTPNDIVEFIKALIIYKPFI